MTVGLLTGPGARQRIPTPNPLIWTSREGLAVDATHEHEEWRPVFGFEGVYEVSDLGRVRSVDRVVTFPDGRRRRAPGRVLKPWIANGYPKVGLKHQGQSKKLYVHDIVLTAFIGRRPDGAACCHGDGVRTNNRLENLRWGTFSENNYDLVAHGTHHQASKTHCPQGHPYSLENTRLYHYQGWRYRYCRACQSERKAA